MSDNVPNFNLSINQNQRNKVQMPQQHIVRARRNHVSNIFQLKMEIRNSILVPETHQHSAFFSKDHRTTRSFSPNGPVKLIMLGLCLSACVRGIQCMESGVRISESSPGASLSPELSTENGPHYCSSTMLSSKQVITAKHCLGKGLLKALDRNNQWQPPIKAEKHPTDMVVLTYRNDLKGAGTCPPPIMLKETYAKLEKAEENTCGIKGNFLIMARGGKTAHRTGVDRKLDSGMFNLKQELTPTATFLVGEVTEGVQVKTRSGDSGGTVLACNPETGKFEFVGVHVAGRNIEDGVKGSIIVNIAKSEELREWLMSKIITCIGEILNPYQLHPTSEHPREFWPHPRTCITTQSMIQNMNTPMLRVKNNCPSTVIVTFIGQNRRKQKPPFYIGSGEYKNRPVNGLVRLKIVYAPD